MTAKIYKSAEERRTAYWSRNNVSCKNICCPNHLISPKDLTESGIIYGAFGLCGKCYQRKKYPPVGKIVAKGDMMTKFEKTQNLIVRINGALSDSSIYSIPVKDKILRECKQFLIWSVKNHGER